MRKIIYLLVFVVFSCSKDSIETYENLAEYIVINNIDKENNVIACAASGKNEVDKIYVFFYPIPGATEIKYFETSNVEVSKNDFDSYNEIDLKKEPVFNGYLQRFVKENSNEVWCIVTYKIDGLLRVAQPIRIKNETKSTEWIDDVMIDFNEKQNPVFSWEDGSIAENEIYFEVITDIDDNFLSGTYTYNKWFQYYNLDNVVLNVTRNTPPQLLLNNSYNFTLMAVSLDNWVNLVIQKEFLIPN